MKTKYQLIVVGGGFAGVGAAISAAKEGVDVLLIERYNCLRGAPGFALVSPFMEFSTKNPETGERQYLCGDLFLEIIREMNPILGIHTDFIGREFDEEISKLVLNRMCKKYGAKLLFNTNVISADACGGHVVQIPRKRKKKNTHSGAFLFVLRDRKR